MVFVTSLDPGERLVLLAQAEVCLCEQKRGDVAMARDQTCPISIVPLVAGIVRPTFRAGGGWCEDGEERTSRRRRRRLHTTRLWLSLVATVVNPPDFLGIAVNRNPRNGTGRAGRRQGGNDSMDLSALAA